MLSFTEWSASVMFADVPGTQNLATFSTDTLNNDRYVALVAFEHIALDFDGPPLLIFRRLRLWHCDTELDC